MVFFGNTPDESQLGLIVAMLHCLKFSNGAVEWACPLPDARSVTTMSWFRSRSRLGAYLALFALAFQLAVSFGHVHLVAPVSAGASALAHAQQSATDLNAPSNPTGRENLADDRCPICTLIHLVGALVPAETPSLPLPTIIGRLRLELAAEFDLTASHAALFRARTSHRLTSTVVSERPRASEGWADTPCGAAFAVMG